MKLYTKKNIWAVLAMGLMVCSSVDAGVVKRKRKERCAGAIIDAARNAGAKGTVTMAEIEANGKKCTYTGSVPGVPTSTSYAFKERRNKLRQYQKYITENDDCNPESTVCLREDKNSIREYRKDPTCTSMCRGYVVKKANETGVEGNLDTSNIKDEVKGGFKNRQCACFFNDESATFLMNKSSQDKKNKELINTYDHAKSKECDSSTEMCIPPEHKQLRVKVTRFGNSTYIGLT
jgi:hypothetical protein